MSRSGRTGEDEASARFGLFVFADAGFRMKNRHLFKKENSK
jgi:hypothetical protein